MRANILACLLVFGAIGCAGTREPGTDAGPTATQRSVPDERSDGPERPEDVRIFYHDQPYCPYLVVGQVESRFRGMNRQKDLRAQAFARKADAIINLVANGEGGEIGTAIAFTDPDCRY